MPGTAFVCPGLLDSAACAAVVAEAEALAAHNGGWTTQRHYAVPTTAPGRGAAEVLGCLESDSIAVFFFCNRLTAVLIQGRLGRTMNNNREKIICIVFMNIFLAFPRN